MKSEKVIKQGMKEMLHFHSKVKNEVVYMSYAPVDYSDWELLVFAPDSVCMESANQSQYAAYKAIFIIMAAFAVFFIMLVVGENRRIRQNEEKEKELRDALLKATGQMLRSLNSFPECPMISARR